MNRSILTLAPVLALLAFTAGCDDFELDMGGPRIEAPFHYSYDVKPGARIDLETFNGSIEVRSWDQNKVDVSGTKYARTSQLRDQIRIDASATPDSVSVRAVRPAERHGNMGAKFVVRVPVGVTLDRASSSNGSITVDGINGSVRARTSNGAMHLSHLRGALDAQTSNGGIDVSELTGNAVLQSSNGHIHVDHIGGVVDAQTSNGGVTVAFENSPKSDIHVSTSNSGIEITMPANSAVRVRASTNNSSISSDFDVASSGANSKTHLEGAINGGGPLLDLTTSNGSIKIVKP